MMPAYEDLLRIQAIEFNDQFRKSAHSFNITNNKLQIFPLPTSNNTPNRLYFEYMVRNEFIANSTSVRVHHTITRRYLYHLEGLRMEFLRIPTREAITIIATLRRIVLFHGNVISSTLKKYR